MSYDLAVWAGEHPLNDEQAGAAYDELYERYLDSEGAATAPTPSIVAYVKELLKRYPDGDVNSGTSTVWAAPPVMDEASGPIVYLLMSYSNAEEVSAYAASLAHEQGLVCYDPQEERLRP
jgi:hypothetical protein